MLHVGDRVYSPTTVKDVSKLIPHRSLHDADNIPARHICDQLNARQSHDGFRTCWRHPRARRENTASPSDQGRIRYAGCILFLKVRHTQFSVNPEKALPSSENRPRRWPQADTYRQARTRSVHESAAYDTDTSSRAKSVAIPHECANRLTRSQILPSSRHLEKPTPRTCHVAERKFSTPCCQRFKVCQLPHCLACGPAAKSQSATDSVSHWATLLVLETPGSADSTTT
jgi:hypothetical protein